MGRGGREARLIVSVYATGRAQTDILLRVSEARVRYTLDRKGN